MVKERNKETKKKDGVIYIYCLRATGDIVDKLDFRRIRLNCCFILGPFYVECVKKNTQARSYLLMAIFSAQMHVFNRL